MCGASFAEHHVQVDLDRPNHEAFPQFASLPFAECVLEPGQMLYVPPLWWHYVKGLTISLSVSFWWQ
jgi:lysine-specific demethylase 8